VVNEEGGHLSLKHIVRGLLLGAVVVAGTACGGKSKPAKPEPAVANSVKPAVPGFQAAFVDINTATQDQLESLPGIGREHCHHIMMARPYASKDELVTRNVIPQENYDKIKDMIVASTPKE
jgi:DNA uptake protein ComE-like DNA-binding protein